MEAGGGALRATDLTAEEAHLRHLVCDTAPDSKHGGSYVSFTSLLQIQTRRGGRTSSAAHPLARQRAPTARRCARCTSARPKVGAPRAPRAGSSVWAAKKAAAPSTRASARATPTRRRRRRPATAGAAAGAASDGAPGGGQGREPGEGATPARGKTFSGLLDAALGVADVAACLRRASASAAERRARVERGRRRRRRARRRRRRGWRPKARNHRLPAIAHQRSRRPQAVA